MPDTPANREAFGAGANDGPFPKVRLVTVCECGSRAPVLAAMGPSVVQGQRGAVPGQDALPAAGGRLAAARGPAFYGWADWCAAAGSGADLLWRVKRELGLPCLELLPDGSYRSVLMKTSITRRRRDGLIEAARRGEDLDPAMARHVRVVEYEVTDRDGEDEPDHPGHHHHRLAGRPGRRPGRGLPRKMAARDRERAVQNRPARPRQDPALGQPGTGPRRRSGATCSPPGPSAP